MELRIEDVEKKPILSMFTFNNDGVHYTYTHTRP